MLCLTAAELRCVAVRPRISHRWLQERVKRAEDSGAEQQQADADMQASTARQHAGELAELQGQVEALQEQCKATEGQAAGLRQVSAALACMHSFRLIAMLSVLSSVLGPKF